MTPSDEAVVSLQFLKILTAVKMKGTTNSEKKTVTMHAITALLHSQLREQKETKMTMPKENFLRWHLNWGQFV